MNAPDRCAGMTADRRPARLKGGGIRADDGMAVDALLIDDEADLPAGKRQERIT